MLATCIHIIPIDPLHNSCKLWRMLGTVESIRMRVKKGTVVLVVSLLVLGGLLWHHSSNATGLPKSDRPRKLFSHSKNGDCESYLSRLERYCHPPLQADTANEGTLSPSAAEQFQLVQVHIIARHGDRTPATSYNIGTQPVRYECGLVDNDPKWLGLKDFPPRISLSSSFSNTKLGLFPGTESKHCSVGSLTFEGFKMEYALGSLMQQRYTQFIRERIDVDKVFTHTTDYPRTIQSAGAFLLGFLPDDPLIRHRALIHTSTSTMLQYPPTRIRPTYWYSCERYFSFLHKDQVKSGYLTEEKQTYHYLVEKMCDMFKIHKRNEPIITEVFDHLMTRGCHTPVAANGTGFLPCNMQGECVDCALAVKLFEFADWTWRHKYPLNSSIVAMLPFLKHSVVDIMENAINHQEPIKNFMLSFTHDTTLAQLLTTLCSTPVIYEWMPYASRLVFELWRDRDQADPQYYVRVLFNGEPITNKIPFSQPRSAAEKEHQLVLFSTWKEHLMTGNFRDIQSYNAICTRKQIPFF